MDSINFYDILECSQHDSEDEIKKQYKKLALKFHPDKNNSNSEQFDFLKKAYETLSNDKTRREYDIELLRRTSRESDMIVTDTITLSELTKAEEGTYFYYDCRCGGQFMINEHNLCEYIANQTRDVHVQCDSCSLFLHVTEIQ